MKLFPFISICSLYEHIYAWNLQTYLLDNAKPRLFNGRLRFSFDLLLEFIWKHTGFFPEAFEYNFL